MTDLLPPLIGLIVGYALAIATIYVTAICVRRIQHGKSIAPSLPTSKRRGGDDDAEPGYTSRYEGHRY